MIVVGAGASTEANLPSGYELKERIADVLDIRFEDGVRRISGDHAVYEAIRLAIRRDEPDLRDVSLHLQAAWRIRDAMPQAISIDNFIDAHQGDRKIELCGKLAIVRSILKAERQSILFVDRQGGSLSLNYQSLEATWFNAFMQLLTENCKVDRLAERLSSIRLIVFNYDRCIEHFLYHSLQNYYGINHELAGSLVRDIEIYHPYGTVGNLPWYRSEHAVEFGAEPSSNQLVDLVSQIKTFTEGTDPNSSDVAKIRDGMAEARIVLFLGFAFHRLNLELIRPLRNANSTLGDVRYFGTAVGISGSDCDVISSELAVLGGAKVENIALRNDLKCSKLFQEYWRSLSLS